MLFSWYFGVVIAAQALDVPGSGRVKAALVWVELGSNDA